ncbi:MAG: hypothetical protein R3C27_03465 [Hyphomonadaceae bacterium]
MPTPFDLLGLTRRGALPAFAIFALLAEARAQEGPRVRADRWIEAQSEIAQALSDGRISPRSWMDEVEALTREVDLAELMTTVGRARLTDAGRGASNDPFKRSVRFLDAAGQPRRLGYAAALFEFEPHNVITPHGHRHMASAHVVVEGALRVRNFDRIGDTDSAMIIRPTRDYIADVGHVSTMSSERDNIHWFVPTGRRAMTFDIIVSGLDPGQPHYEIRAIDPIGGTPRSNGDIVAPIIGFEEASRRYTASV